MYDLYDFLLWELKTNQAKVTVITWQIENRYVDLVKIESKTLDPKAQINPGIYPQRATTEMLSKESKYKGKTIVSARIEPQ